MVVASFVKYENDKVILAKGRSEMFNLSISEVHELCNTFCFFENWNETILTEDIFYLLKTFFTKYIHPKLYGKWCLYKKLLANHQINFLYIKMSWCWKKMNFRWVTYIVNYITNKRWAALFTLAKTITLKIASTNFVSFQSFVSTKLKISFKVCFVRMLYIYDFLWLCLS